MSATAEELLLQQRRALNEGIRALRRRLAAGGLTQEDADRLLEQIHTLEDALAGVNSRINSLGAAPIPGPDEVVFRDVRDRADRLARATADNLQVSAIIRLVNEALQRG